MVRPRRRLPFIIANPTESDFEDSGSDDSPSRVPSSFPNLDPPAPIILPASTSFPSSVAPDDVSGSSRSSPAPDTTPPRTPSQILPPVNIASDPLDINIAIHDRSYHHQPHHDREPDKHSIGRVPLHVRRPSNDPAKSQSPVLSISQPYAPLSPTDHHPEPRIIMVTADSDTFLKVNITSVSSGEVIREMIFSTLQVADEDQPGFSIFQTELGDSAIGDALSDDQLNEICSRSADGKGTLKFMIQRISLKVYVRPDVRALPIPPPPTTVPPLPKGPPPQLAVVPPAFRAGTRNGARSSPQSQHDTSSSASERRAAAAGSLGGAYDPSPTDELDDSRDSRRRVGILRSYRSNQQLSRPNQIPQTPQPPPPASQRPSVGIHRVPKSAIARGVEHTLSPSQYTTSPLRGSPGGLINGTSDSNSSYNQHYLHHLPPLPPVTPLQIDRRGNATPTPPIHGGNPASLSPPNSRDGIKTIEALYSHHGRRGSETAAERERLLEQSEAAQRALSQSRQSEKERREREYYREREEIQLIRLQETKLWLKENGGDSSSPSDTLSPSGSWFFVDRPELRSRPGTTGNVAARVGYVDANTERDRPSTAQPILRPQGAAPGYGVRSPGLFPSARPLTGSSTGSTPRPLDLQRADPPRVKGPTQQSGQATMLPPLDSRTILAHDRGKAVPPNWLVQWRASDGRTTPMTKQQPQQSHRAPLSAGSKSMDNLRNQYFGGSAATGGMGFSPSPKSHLQRRLPTPTQRGAPNNYGGLSEYGTAIGASSSPPAQLPYHDQPSSRGGGTSAGYTSGRSGGGQSSGTTTPSDYNRAPWHQERPRSPQRGSPNIGVFRPDPDAQRPYYVPPPPPPMPVRAAENVVRGESAGSFGQAALNLSPRLGRVDAAPTLPSPLDDSEHDGMSLRGEQGDDKWSKELLGMFRGGMVSGREESTVIPPGKQRPMQSPTSATSSSTATGTNSSINSSTGTMMSIPSSATSIPGSTPYPRKLDDEEFLSSSEEDDSEAGTLWQPTERRRASKQLRVQTGVSSIPPVPSGPPPSIPNHGGSSSAWKPRSPTTGGSSANVNRYSSFTKRDSDTWAFRPAPEDMYERLEEFFPDHDLDRPFIDAAPSGGSSPTQAEHPPQHAAFPLAQNRARHKKSIRVVVSDRKSKMMGSPTQNMLRKRSTKLWGSRVEEVTPAQAKGGALSAAPDSSPGTSNPPKAIFKWVKGDLIGKGTYGRVYLALNATTGDMIAVKQVELPRTVSDQADNRQLQVVEALKSESDTLKDLDHPNIVQYLGFEQSAEFFSIFLEYVPGGSVGGCLRKHGKFDHNVVRSFTAQVVSGLEYLHSRGVLHRDLKADNILLDPSGICKISDFGISKRSSDIYDNDTQLTAMQGSLFWMAPEVLHNNRQGYNAKIDIWSLGCVVLEMWAGRRPWSQEDMYAVMFKLGASREAPPVPDDVELDEVEDDFRRKCFAVNPNERPTAAELSKHKFLELKPGWVFTGIH